MNKRITVLYMLIKDNKVEVCESNISEFYELFPEDLKIFGYDYYYSKIKESNYFRVPANGHYIIQRMDY